MTKLQLPSHPIPDRVTISGMASQHGPFTRKTYAELEGPGCVRHFWLCVGRDPSLGRKSVLRIFFDGSDVPHVEAPASDFFGVMHRQGWYSINTHFLSVQAETGYNCYFPMPFAKSARFEIESGDARLDLYLMQSKWIPV